MRKLVTIRKINNLIPIKGADFIELAVVGGWTVIVKKGEFAVDNYCVFFEIDSFLPDKPEFAFLKKTTTYNGFTGYRLKTMKMRGCLSQGLALPYHTFGFNHATVVQWFEAGNDISEQLGVIKYDVASATQKSGLKAGKPRGTFPTFIPKTDQERIQNLTHYFETHVDHEFEETLKLDGSSMTCYKVDKLLSWWQKPLLWLGINFDRTHFGVCSRNLEIKPTDNKVTTFDNDGKPSVYDQSDFWTVAIRDNLSCIPKGYAIQGELIGPKIQANHERVTDLDFYVFDVFDISKQQYLLPSERRNFCENFGLKHVPVVSESVKIFQEHPNLQSLLQHVEGESMNPKTVSEGRVYKSTTIPNLTFKAISNQYLLKCEK